MMEWQAPYRRVSSLQHARVANGRLSRTASCKRRYTASLLALLCLAGTAHAQVFAIFAPGQGENITSQRQVTDLPRSFASQAEMYRNLARVADSVTNAELDSYYRRIDLAPVRSENIGSRERPKIGVTVVRDKTHNVPHVTGTTRADVMFGMGFARAQDRLWQMEVNRYSWRAQKSVLLGAGRDNENLADDAELFAKIDYSDAEYRVMFDRLARDHGAAGRQVQADLRAYCAGINSFIAHAVADPRLMPVEFKRRRLVPRPWRVTDEIAAVAAGHALFWAQGGELRNALLLQQLRLRLGAARGQLAFDDLRHREGGVSPVVKDIRFANDDGARDDPAALAMPDPNTLQPRTPLEITGSTARSVQVAIMAATPPRRLKSNAILLSGARSQTGRPISVQGPQDGYGTPHPIDSEIQFSGPDFEGQGIFEFGPYPYNGARGRDFAFSLTVQYSDIADTFAERLCERDGRKPTLLSGSYRYRGRCIPFATRIDRILMLDGSGMLRRVSQRSVHGPILGRALVGGVPVAYSLARAAYMQEGRALVASSQLFQPSRVHSARSFLEVVLRGSFDVGYYYIDARNIAYAATAITAKRRRGVTGDFPVWGDGWDWVDFESSPYRFRETPPELKPHVIDPPDGIIAGWNNQVAPGWKVREDVMFLTDVHRVQMLSDPVRTSDKRLALGDLVRIHQKAALTDVSAKALLPPVLRLLDRPTHDGSRQAVASLAAWNAAGARREEDAQGRLKHSGAIALFDRWTPLLIRAALGSILGDAVLDTAGTASSNLRDIGSEPGLASELIDLVRRDLDGVGGDRSSPLNLSYCGKGSRDACLRAVEASLKQAVAGDSGAMASVAATCDARCHQIEFPSSGDAKPLPSIPWQNRPTFEMVVSF